MPEVQGFLFCFHPSARAIYACTLTRQYACRDNDGFVTAEDLKSKLGSQEDVGQLIAAADKNGDGKIDYAEFCELLKNS